jgi:hypothetical protein
MAKAAGNSDSLDLKPPRPPSTLQEPVKLPRRSNLAERKSMQTARQSVKEL